MDFHVQDGEDYYDYILNQMEQPNSGEAPEAK